MREIVLHLEESELGNAQFRPGVMTAIGRLSLWGMRYPKVIVAVDTAGQDGNPPDLIATFWAEAGADRPSFVIGALWDSRESKYTYHS